MQSRYYNPEWGRFINADAIIGQVGQLLGHNMFAYTKNNPTNFKDDSGFVSSHVSYDIGEGNYGDVGKVINEGTINSNSIISNIIDIVTGIASTISKNAPDIAMQIAKGNGSKILEVIPKCITPKNLMPYAEAASKVSGRFTAAMAGFDLLNIWTADSGLSTSQNMLKSGVKIGTVAAGVYVGGLIGAGALAVGGGVLGASIIVGGTGISSFTLDLAERFIYKKLGLGE